MRTIEYQKRGFPHGHILVFLDNEHDRFDTAEKIDQIICAEIPDKEKDPELYEVIVKNMMHGPCGKHSPSSPCMADNAFGIKEGSKKFPKDIQPVTISKNDGYPLYRRRADGRSYQIRHPLNRNQDFHMTNEWVVPYNPYLSKKFKAHINVEICASVKAIKYINKYIYKGSDKTTISLRYENDEIVKYLNGRYNSSVEAAWRIFEFQMHEEIPSVTTLAIHMPDKQPVFFLSIMVKAKNY